MEETTRKEKLRLAGIKRYGTEEAWRQAKREQGARARRDTPRGFAVMDKAKVKEASKKGLEARWHSSTE